MTAYKKYILPSIIILLVVIGIGFLLFSRSDQSPSDAPMSKTDHTEGVQLELISEVEGWAPVEGPAVRQALIDILDEIHFWDEGVRHVNAVDNMGGKLNRLVVRLSSEPQKFNKSQIKKDGETVELFSYGFALDNGSGTLSIYANPQETTPETLRIYMLQSLYQLSFWTLNQNKLDTKEYNIAQIRFVDAASPMTYWFSSTKQ